MFANMDEVFFALDEETLIIIHVTRPIRTVKTLCTATRKPR